MTVDVETYSICKVFCIINIMELTEKHWHLIGHSLGIKIYNAKQSKRKKDKYLPDEFYRNYFCSSKGSEDYKNLKELEKIGYTESYKRADSIYFLITKKGIDNFKEYFFTNITKIHNKITKSQENYSDYLYADTGGTFEDWIGVTPPKEEHCYDKGWRISSNKYNNVIGDWKKTKASAKKDYKEKLYTYKRQLKAEKEGSNEID